MLTHTGARSRVEITASASRKNRVAMQINKMGRKKDASQHDALLKKKRQSRLLEEVMP